MSFKQEHASCCGASECCKCLLIAKKQCARVKPLEDAPDENKVHDLNHNRHIQLDNRDCLRLPKTWIKHVVIIIRDCSGKMQGMALETHGVNVA